MESKFFIPVGIFKSRPPYTLTIRLPTSPNNTLVQTLTNIRFPFINCLISQIRVLFSFIKTVRIRVGIISVGVRHWHVMNHLLWLPLECYLWIFMNELINSLFLLNTKPSLFLISFYCGTLRRYYELPTKFVVFPPFTLKSVVFLFVLVFKVGRYPDILYS